MYGRVVRSRRARLLTIARAPRVRGCLLSMTGLCDCGSLPDQRGAVSGTNERAGAEGEGAYAAVPACRRSRSRGRGCPDVRHLHGCLPADAHTLGVSATHIVRSAVAVSSASRARLTCCALVGALCSSPVIECAFGVPGATGPSASIVRSEFVTLRALLWYCCLAGTCRSWKRCSTCTIGRTRTPSTRERCVLAGRLMRVRVM